VIAVEKKTKTLHIDRQTVHVYLHGQQRYLEIIISDDRGSVIMFVQLLKIKLRDSHVVNQANHYGGKMKQCNI